MKKAPEPLLKVWKTRPVFSDLEYSHKLDTPHCLDHMHICKNVLESLLATLMNMPDKTKDGPKARKDLQDLKIREDLHMPPRKISDKIETMTGAREKEGKKIKKEDQSIL